MLEAKTIQKVNELIQKMTDHYIQAIDSYSLDPEDIRVLLGSITAINVPADPPPNSLPVVGFSVSAHLDDGEEE